MTSELIENRLKEEVRKIVDEAIASEEERSKDTLYYEDWHGIDLSIEALGLDGQFIESDSYFLKLYGEAQKMQCAQSSMECLNY